MPTPWNTPLLKCRHRLPEYRRTAGLVFGVLLLPGLMLCGAPREFFVAPSGSDDAPGARERPFAGIQRAMAVVRTLDLRAHPGTPVTVFLREGTYTLNAPLVFGPGDTGTKASPVTYRAWPGETAIISGGRRIEGVWTRVPGKPYYQVHVPAAENRKWVFNSLYVNGQSRTRARVPNWDRKVFRAAGRAPGEDPRQAFAYFPGDIDPTWKNLTDIDIVLLCSWTPTIHRIREVVPGQRVVRFRSSHGRAVDAWERNFRYYLSNVFEGLDEPGEWYLDRPSGVLYYYPLANEDMTAAEVVAPVLKSRLITFRGDVDHGRFIEYLRFEGLHFRHVDGDLDRYNGMYRQGHMFLDAALYAEGLRHCTFARCEMSQLGEYALEMTKGCRDNRIEQCHIWDLGAGAMQIGITSLGALLSARNGVRPDDLVVEAENAEVTPPMVVGSDDGASGGRYVWLPEGGENGKAVFSVRVDKAGRYSLFARVLAASGTQDSFYVAVNDGPRFTWDTGTYSRWSLSKVVARELGGQPLVAEFATGRNRVTILGREAGTKLDQLILRRQRPGAGPAKTASEADVLNISIDNNCIHRIGTIWHGCYGIVNRFASFTRITHNDISDTHWDAIGLDARWTYHGEKYSHGNVVAYNHLHHLGLHYHADAGGVYQFGPLDTHIHHNRIHDTMAYPYICGYAGVYLDEQSRGALVENNLVYDTDWYAYFQHKGVDNTFRNNIGAFARDGFILRGGLNDHWKTNTFEVYRNIYISGDSIAIKNAWQPGLKPPVIRDNMYYSTTAGTELTFGGKSLTEWQTMGNDRGSVLGDPGCRAPVKRDFTLRPNAPAIAAIGFQSFDADIRKAGLYGDPAWVKLPSTLSRRTPAPVWTPDDLSRLVAFSYDFEDMPDGCEPRIFNLVKEGSATFSVSSEAAKSGSKSLKCVDHKGLRKPFYPYIHLAPRGLKKGKVTFAVDVLNSPDQPMHAQLEFRGKGFTSDIGPSIHFNRDGSIVANGVAVATVSPGTWCGIVVSLDLGPDQPRNYRLRIEHDGQTTTRDLPYTHKTFSDIRWLGITASDDAEGVMYLDNMSLKIE